MTDAPDFILLDDLFAEGEDPAIVERERRRRRLRRALEAVIALVDELPERIVLDELHAVVRHVRRRRG